MMSHLDITMRGSQRVKRFGEMLGDGCQRCGLELLLTAFIRRKSGKCSKFFVQV